MEHSPQSERLSSVSTFHLDYTFAALTRAYTIGLCYYAVSVDVLAKCPTQGKPCIIFRSLSTTLAEHHVIVSSIRLQFICTYPEANAQ
jgi:hypothetical protein